MSDSVITPWGILVLSEEGQQVGTYQTIFDYSQKPIPFISPEELQFYFDKINIQSESEDNEF